MRTEKYETLYLSIKKKNMNIISYNKENFQNDN